MISGALGPLIGAVALFALPLIGALFLDTEHFAFWAILSSISTIALSLDFGGLALLAARFYSESRVRLIVKSSALSAFGSILVGAIASVLWVATSGTSLGSVVAVTEAVAAILTMSAACALRSILTVFAQASLILEKPRIRNVATAVQAFAAVIVTFALLALNVNFWALPLGWLISASLVMLPVLWMSSRGGMWEQHLQTIDQPFRTRRFAVVRTVTTLLNAVLLQGDRWVVGILGGPSALAIYEVAWRFATLPRFLVQNLLIRTGADASSMTIDDQENFTSLVRKSLLIGAIAGFGSALLVTGGYLAFTWIAAREQDLLLVTMMMVAFTSLGVVSVYSFVGASLGRASIDIPYVLVGIVLAGAAALAGFAVDDVFVFEVGYLASILVCSATFALYAPRMLGRSLGSRTAAPIPA